jgi:hypothetical protein
MRKFTNLIIESKGENRKMDALMNPTDWEEIFKPLIEHIDENLESNSKGPGNSVFKKSTKVILDELISKVEKDYRDYFKNEIHDGSQESFLNAFNINVDHKDIMNCIQPLLDRADDIDDFGDFDIGAFVVDISSIKYNTIEEIVEDLADVHGKLKMIDADFTIRAEKLAYIKGTTTKRKAGDLHLSKTHINDHDIKEERKDIGEILLSEVTRDEEIGFIRIYIFNKETVNNQNNYL